MRDRPLVDGARPPITYSTRTTRACVAHQPHASTSFRKRIDRHILAGVVYRVPHANDLTNGMPNLSQVVLTVVHSCKCICISTTPAFPIPTLFLSLSHPAIYFSFALPVVFSSSSSVTFSFPAANFSHSSSSAHSSIPSRSNASIRCTNSPQKAVCLERFPSILNECVPRELH